MALAVEAFHPQGRMSPPLVIVEEGVILNQRRLPGGWSRRIVVLLDGRVTPERRELWWSKIQLKAKRNGESIY